MVYPFSINEVKFNSGLNEDFKNALEQGESGFDKIQPIVADYEMNYRQLVLYVVDCELVKCDKTSM